MKYLLCILTVFILSSCTTTEQEVTEVKEEEKRHTMLTNVSVSWADHFEVLILSKENPVSAKWDLKLIQVHSDGSVEIENLLSRERITEYPTKISDESESIYRNFTIYRLEQYDDVDTVGFRIVGTVRTSKTE